MWNKDILDDMVVLDFFNAPKEKMISRAGELNKEFYTVKYEQALETS